MHCTKDPREVNMDKEEKSNGKHNSKKQARLSKLIKDYQIPADQVPSTTEELEELISKLLNEKQKDLIEILDDKKKPKYRQSGHYVDQKLTPVPKEQRTIFDFIEDETVKGKIVKHEIKALGIHLDPTEDKLMNAIQRLLHEKSEHHNQNDPGFYAGNAGKDLIPYGKKEASSPRLKIKPSELYKAYFDKEDYSGADIKHIKSVLTSLASKKFLLAINRKRVIKDSKGKTKTVTDRIEEVQSLIRVIKFYQGLSDEDLTKLDKEYPEEVSNKGELVIGLNPILCDQISTKYVEYPIDINKRMCKAAGGAKRVTQAMNKLRDLMLRELSSKRTMASYNEDTLIRMLHLDNYLRARKKSLAIKRLQKAIEALSTINLIQNTEISHGSEGQVKYTFQINPKFS